ncbi:MAG: ABC transporter ATP-binding protein [Clostridia bacterium]|nr:ABC transporter ATP-binding protein [Clostridia bacterium]
MGFLKIDNITMQFGGLRAVDSVSMEVHQGEIVSLIGPNGAGKTTVFNMITGVYQITSGSMDFLGEKLEGKMPQEIVQLGIARTFQNLRLFPKMRVIENVMVGMHTNTSYNFFDSLFRTPRFRREESEKQVKAVEILESIGLAHYIDSYAESLPYGEQRKVEIARAMATDAKLLLLDEPAAGMNPAESEELLEFIRHLRDIGYTVLLIEHDMNVVMNISDRIYVLDHGKLIANGLPHEIANNQNVIDAYLGGEREKNAEN